MTNPPRIRPLSTVIIGLGGLGCPASLALAADGVSKLTLIDPDTVDESNWHRQSWFDTEDVGHPKAERAALRLKARFPHLQVTPRVEAVTVDNVQALLKQHTLAIDGTDDTRVKFLLSDAAVATSTPLVFGGVIRLEGLAFRIRPSGPCLRCLFEVPDAETLSCAYAGVMGSVAGVIGALQGELALSPLEDIGKATLHRFDGTSMRHRKVNIARAPDCPACNGPTEALWNAWRKGDDAWQMRAKALPS